MNTIKIVLLINSKEYNADGSLYIVVNYSHDEKGFITKAKYNRSLQKTYDDQRSSIEVEYYKYYNQLFGYIVYRNDYKGFVLYETYFTDDNTLAYKYSYGYNYKFYRVETKFYNNKGKLSWKEKMKYGLKDNKKESTLFKSNRKAQTTIYTYEFDSKNNWTKQIETRLLYDNFFLQMSSMTIQL